ncbi:hypothetical protein LY76DRAFT_587044 [Colletotrichum caudatum]|nr:hypothetical protein LY76DRAFT_587044 [Colletotrichum caudatum]
MVIIAPRLFPTGERRADGWDDAGGRLGQDLDLYPLMCSSWRSENSAISKTPPASTSDPPGCYTDPSIVTKVMTMSRSPFPEKGLSMSTYAIPIVPVDQEERDRSTLARASCAHIGSSIPGRTTSPGG